MTEPIEDGANYLVQVRAQVMTRDDSTGGWVPMTGGGLSNVSVCRRRLYPPEETKHEYYIYGKRIFDQAVVLSCAIKKDFEYHKVMPTFHHWKTGDKKFGLTFQTAADARAFDKGVKTAIDELQDGLNVTLPPNLQPQFNLEDTGDGDDDVFMTLNLPVDRGDSNTSSSTSSAKPMPPPLPRPLVLDTDSSYSYVHLESAHDYLYPEIKETKFSSGSLKKPALPPKRRERCRFCQETYTNETNQKGSCRYAPDSIRDGIENLTCITCTKRLFFPDENRHPCHCDEGCGRRWLYLTLLSFVIPCLWCYPPLRACHFCCISCGVCGAKHQHHDSNSR